MELTDLLSVEDWVQFEKDFSEASHLTPAVFNAEGGRVTDSAFWCNRLCPGIRQNPKALAQVCALAHQNMATMARNSRKPVVEECDAGMVKIVAPVFSGDEFIGAVGGCGRRFPDSQVEEEYLVEVSGLSPEEIHLLASEVGITTEDEAQSLADALAERVRQILEKS